MNTRVLKIKSSCSVAVAFISLGLCVSSTTAQAKVGDVAGIGIKNFGKMDDRFYRGAQPKEGDYAALAALGIKTIIDLRDDPTSYESTLAEAAGLRYINIPMSDKSRPRDQQIAGFLKLVDDPATGAFFVHCEGGRHRTGVIAAVYRFIHDGWTFEQAYKEMKDYDYYSRWGHGAMKEFVRDYYAGLQGRAKNVTVVSR